MHVCIRCHDFQVCVNLNITIAVDPSLNAKSQLCMHACDMNPVLMLVYRGPKNNKHNGLKCPKEQFRRNLWVANLGNSAKSLLVSGLYAQNDYSTSRREKHTQTKVLQPPCACATGDIDLRTI